MYWGRPPHIRVRAAQDEDGTRMTDTQLRDEAMTLYLAGHETTVVESGSPGYRTKIWMAPDLACFALKLTDEAQGSNGAYRLKLRKEAVKSLRA